MYRVRFISGRCPCESSSTAALHILGQYTWIVVVDCRETPSGHKLGLSCPSSPATPRKDEPASEADSRASSQLFRMDYLDADRL